VYDGKNCYGEEKARRFRARYGDERIDAFYSDSLSDVPLAGLAEQSFMVKGGRLVPWQAAKEPLLTTIKRTYFSRDFIIFVFCGGMGTLVNFIVSLLVSRSVNPSIAYIAGYGVGIFVTYSFNGLLLFHTKLSFIQFIKFIISYLPNFIILYTFVLFFLNILGWNKVVVYALAGLLGLPVTFILVKLIAFKKNNHAENHEPLKTTLNRGNETCKKKKPNSMPLPENLNRWFVKVLGFSANSKQKLSAIKASILNILCNPPPPPPPSENRKFSILDFGCGIGRNIPYFKEFFPDADIYGCDISEESIKKAASDFPGCHFTVIETVDDLRVYKGVIDCVFISTVLHHIPHQEHTAWIRALHNIMKKNAYLIIFEMNMYNPLAKRFVYNCPFDANAVMLKPSYCKKLAGDIFGKADMAYTFFFPWRNKFFITLEHLLSWLPLGAQYYVAARK
jgi:putative flippase GtrA/SAM-dependent methyltransferase